MKISAHADYRERDYRFQRTLNRGDGVPLQRSKPYRSWLAVVFSLLFGSEP
jgi:hypothetical protein